MGMNGCVEDTGRTCEEGTASFGMISRHGNLTPELMRPSSWQFPAGVSAWHASPRLEAVARPRSPGPSRHFLTMDFAPSAPTSRLPVALEPSSKVAVTFGSPL